MSQQPGENVIKLFFFVTNKSECLTQSSLIDVSKAKSLPMECGIAGCSIRSGFGLANKH